MSCNDCHDVRHCPHCGRLLADCNDRCSHCAEVVGEPEATSQDGEEVRLTPIARFTSAAEAGYFTNELMEQHQIPGKITAVDDFHAPSGSWSTRYVLAVPEAMAESAAAAFKARLEQDEAEELADSWDEETGFHTETETALGSADVGDQASPEPFESEDDSLAVPDGWAPSESNVSWFPILLTLAAGSTVFWWASRLDDRPKRARVAAPASRQDDDFWGHLTQEPNPWVQQLRNGRGVRQLTIDEETGIVTIREDANGDGVFEQEWPFQGADVRQ